MTFAQILQGGAAPLPEEPPSAPPAAAGGSRYERLFAVDEIARTPQLQWFFAVTLFGYFITFWEWAGEPGITREAVAAGKHRCWPHFQSCAKWYVLEALPHGYSYTAVYMALFVLMGLAVGAVALRRWAIAHGLLLTLFAWKFFVYFFLSMTYNGNYHHFHLAFSYVLLFAPYKLFFLRRGLVLLYFCAAVIKIHEGWILGTYFTSMHTGIPLFPAAITPLLTNFVILLETVGAPLLLSRRPRVQRLAVFAFLLFHLYSGVLVKYMYPSIMVPALLVLFGPRVTPMESPLRLRALPGWAMFVVALAGQSVSFLIQGDVKLTLEGNFYGLYMFEANHQCRSRIQIDRQDGTSRVLNHESTSARRRCDPYSEWFRLKDHCRREGRLAARVSWQFDHAINGGPFYRIVDEPDACALEYRVFRHNPWIRLPEEGAIPVGRSVLNYYD